MTGRNLSPFFLIFLYLLALPAAALAQGPEILAGISYLEASQGSTGAWGPEATRTRDTATVLDSLDLLLAQGPAFDRGLAYVRSARAPSLDHEARRIVTLGRAGDDTDALEAALRDARNGVELDPARPNFPEGGWGIARGFASEVLDSALARRTGVNWARFT